MATSALGLTDKTNEGLKAALSGVTPDQLLALKQADQAFELKMKEAGFADAQAIAALVVSDTKDARAMQVATKSIMPAVLATIITVGFLGLLAGMMFGQIKVQDNQAMLLMLGSLTTGWTVALHFFLGGTQAQARSTELLSKAPAIPDKG